MKFKLLYLALFSAIISCSYNERPIDKEKEDVFVIEEASPEAQKQEEYEVVLDEQQALEMNAQVEKEQPVITDEVIEVQDRVFFGYDSAQITAPAKEILNAQTQWLLNNPNINITIEGHCDERGTREYNIALGERRAYAAKKFLINNGVKENRIKTISYGKEKPAFFGNSKEIHAKNRRAVVIEQAK